MKKLFVVLLLLGIAYSASAQWYYRMYGVPSLDNLTEQQLKAGLQKATRISATGAIVTIGGAALIVGGYALLMTSIDADWWLSGLSQVLTGGLLMSVGGLTTGIGIVTWIVGSSRKSAIRLSLVRFTGTAPASGVRLKITF